VETRAYKNPEGLVSALANPAYQTIGPRPNTVVERGYRNWIMCGRSNSWGTGNFRSAAAKAVKTGLQILGISKVYEKYRQLVIGPYQPGLRQSLPLTGLLIGRP